MNSVVFSIGGHRIKVSGEKEIDLLLAMPSFPLFVDNGVEDSVDWSIDMGIHVELEESATELYSFVFDAKKAQCKFLKKDNVFYFTMTSYEEKLCLSYVRGGNHVIVSPSSDSDFLRFALWFSFTLLSASFKTTMIHASTIVYRDKAVLFLGESGTGKSTHTRLWRKHFEGASLLNDDSPIIAIVNGTPIVYGSPWSGKTHCYHNEMYPLAGIVRLSQAPKNSIRKLRTIEAFTAIQPSCPPALSYDEKFSDDIVNLISAILQTIPVFHLACLPDVEAAKMSRNAIFNIG